MHRGRNPDAFVLNLNSGGLPRETANRRSQQRREQGNQVPITHTFEIDTGYFHCQEHRSFYPYFNYEVVRVQTTDRNASIPSDTFYILNFPIDQLSEHLVEEAIQLNPRKIALCNPLSSEVFMNNHFHILDMTLKILRNVDSLTKITLCVDILNVELFRTLSNQSHLREVEILLPSSTFRGRLADIGAVLNEGFADHLLRQVEFFKIPLEILHSFPATVDYLTPIP
jgi:hypothetical protein